MQGVTKSVVATVACVALILGLGLATASRAGEVVDIDGVTHVRNGATPRDGVETLTLRELWRHGGEDDEVFFGLVTQALTDEEGNLYLLDTQLSEVQVFAPDGEPLTPLSREGDGPGETRRPSDMTFLPDGSIGLVQTFPGKIIKIDRQGDPAGVLEIGNSDPTQGGFVVVIDAKPSGENIVTSGINISLDQAKGIQTRTNVLAAYGPDGKEKTRFLERVVTWDFSNLSFVEKDQYFVHFRKWDIDKDGKVYAAPHRNQYAIHVFNPDGSLDRVIEREYEPWKRDESDKKRTQSLADAQTRQIPGEVDVKLEDTEPDITNVHAVADGSIWVLTSRGSRNQPDGIIATYDVFDPEGHFAKQVRMACDGDGVQDGLIFAGDDRIVQITGWFGALIALQGGSGSGEEDEEAEPMEVICYSIAQTAEKLDTN